MRKMTPTQAAICGENLKIRVTPEQSEKMQKAWFAAGKTWQGGYKNISHWDDMIFMFLTDVMTHCGNNDKNCFMTDESEEIELIDESQTNFSSQQETWLWLSSGNGNMVKCENNIVGFKDNKLFSFSHNSYCDFYFKNYQNWQKYTPPKLIRVNGIEVPAPLESFYGLELIWIVDYSNREKTTKLQISRIMTDDLQYWIDIGLCYAKKEDAIARAEAMLKFEVIE